VLRIKVGGKHPEQVDMIIDDLEQLRNLLALGHPVKENDQGWICQVLETQIEIPTSGARVKAKRLISGGPGFMSCPETLFSKNF
jgi:hypothetical protein